MTTEKDMELSEITRLCSAVDAFAAEMKARLYAKVDASYYGWAADSESSPSKGLLAEIHADVVRMQGTPALKEVDIANRAMMLWYRRQPIFQQCITQAPTSQYTQETPPTIKQQIKAELQAESLAWLVEIFGDKEGKCSTGMAVGIINGGFSQVSFDQALRLRRKEDADAIADVIRRMHPYMNMMSVEHAWIEKECPWCKSRSGECTCHDGDL
jgi:hypothetical protein